jgi:CheY-like chemotaxis protein
MKTILLVEDNDNNVSLVEDIFDFDNIPAKLVVVGTGEEAIRRVENLKPALILMDLRLPGMSGLETTQILKERPQTRDIPVWAITAYAMKGDEERARAAGCCEYLTKPSQNGELTGRFRTFLKQLDKQEEELCHFLKS